MSALAGHECGTDLFGREGRAGDEEGSGWSGPAVAAVRTSTNKRCCTLILLRIINKVNNVPVGQI